MMWFALKNSFHPNSYSKAPNFQFYASIGSLACKSDCKKLHNFIETESLNLKENPNILISSNDLNILYEDSNELENSHKDIHKNNNDSGLSLKSNYHLISTFAHIGTRTEIPVQKPIVKQNSKKLSKHKIRKLRRKNKLDKSNSDALTIKNSKDLPICNPNLSIKEAHTNSNKSNIFDLQATIPNSDLNQNNPVIVNLDKSLTESSIEKSHLHKNDNNSVKINEDPNDSIRSYNKMKLYCPKCNEELCLNNVIYDQNHPKYCKKCRIKIMFCCGNCNKMWNDCYSVQQHMILVCGKQPNFTCTQCDFKSHWEKSLIMHMQNIHNIRSINHKN